MLTKAQYDNLPSGIFFDIIIPGYDRFQELRVVGVKGAINDFAVYLGLPSASKEFVARRGDKVYDNHTLTFILNEADISLDILPHHRR